MPATVRTHQWRLHLKSSENITRNYTLKSKILQETHEHKVSFERDCLPNKSNSYKRVWNFKVKSARDTRTGKERIFLALKPYYSAHA